MENKIRLDLKKVDLEVPIGFESWAPEKKEIYIKKKLQKIEIDYKKYELLY